MSPPAPSLRARASTFWLWLSGAAAIGVAILASLLLPSWPPEAACATTGCSEARQWLGLTATVAVFVAGLIQYRRNQEWKRAEFLAAEMHRFLEAPRVRNALWMIDWSERPIDLFLRGVDTPPAVTREQQTGALVPHVLVPRLKDGTGISDSMSGRYTLEEGAIRDTFDVFLDGLERFSAYVRTGLIEAKDLRPYLGYWIDDIAADTEDANDAEWTALLLAYIHYYGFTGTQELFRAFGHDIRPEGAIFRRALRSVRVIDPNDLARLLGGSGIGPRRSGALSSDTLDAGG